MGTSTDLTALSFQFFTEFARMEYALKAAGYLRRSDGNAEASWMKFADAVADDFERERQVHEPLDIAVREFLESPPKKQIVQNWILSWAAAPPVGQSDMETLLLYVCRVRNNLFHGGKFGGRWIAPERASFLLPRSLLILESCRRCSPVVTEAYENGSAGE